MRKLFISILLATTAAGCSTQATKTASEPATAPASEATNKMLSRTPPPVDPLTDPASPLSQRNVYFDFDRSEISGDGLLLLQVHAQYLMEHAATKIAVEGNTDERGSTEYNMGLGERRAMRVKKFLMDQGVNETRIQSISYGKEKPTAMCHDESCWKQNRRVFIKY